MDHSNGDWFVDEFHLRSPIEEFEEYGRLKIERLRDEKGAFDDRDHRAAMALVLEALRKERFGALR